MAIPRGSHEQQNSDTLFRVGMSVKLLVLFGIRKMLSGAKLGRIISTMTLKSAALFALVGMILLTVVLAMGFIRDISAFTSGAIAAMEMLISLIHLLASLGVTVFLYVFHKTQS
jgi:hypothetical protein